MHDMILALSSVSAPRNNTWERLSQTLRLPTFLRQALCETLPRLVKTQQYIKIRKTQPHLLSLHDLSASPRMTLSSFLSRHLGPPQRSLASLPPRLPTTKIAPTNSGSTVSPQLQTMALERNTIPHNGVRHSTDDDIGQPITSDVARSRSKRGNHSRSCFLRHTLTTCV